MTDMDALLVKAQKAWDAMTPDKRRALQEAQRKSWVVGELLIEHEAMTREEAEEIYEKVVEGRGL